MSAIRPSHHVAGDAYGGRVRFSISIPQRDTDGFDDSGFKSYLARAEELGFEGGWTLEQTIGPSPLIAPTGAAVLRRRVHDPAAARRRGAHHVAA